MNSTLESDLKRIKSMAYHRAEWGERLVRKFHALPIKARRHRDFPLLEKLYRWWMAPLSLWPTNLDAIAHEALDSLRKGNGVDPEIALLLATLSAVPGESTQAVAEQHEHEVQRGVYEHLIHAPHKFDYKEQELEHCEELVRDWRKIKAAFRVKEYQDHKGVIRRRLVQERGFRTDWELDWKSGDDRFYAVFNTFCHRWNLYGMQSDKPLLLKTTVNLTPFGTLIFIPAYWNLDAKRDIKWKGITALHRSRGISKQGAKLGMNQIARREDAIRAKGLMEKARQQGLRGDKRDFWVMGQLGWDPRTDSSRLRRLLKAVV